MTMGHLQHEEEIITPPDSRRVKSEAFAINFIRREFMPHSVKRLLVYLVFGYLGINIIIAAALLIMAVGSQLRCNYTQTLIKKSALSTATVKDLEAEMRTLGTEISSRLTQFNSLIAFQKEHFFIADKLAALTRTLPVRTWITKLEGSPGKPKMTIEATFLVDPAHPYQLPTKPWIQSLKQDPDFNQHLRRLELKKSSQQTQGQAELYTFELLAEWEPIALDKERNKK